MTNPLRKHSSSMFASRGCDIDEAIVYANDVITAMPKDIQPHAMTAVMVLVNTAANAFDQAQGPSPEKLAIIDLIRGEIDSWMGDHLDDRLDTWATHQLDMDRNIEQWMDANIEDKVGDAIDNMDLVVRVR
jgi:hypothetical protein